MCHSKLKKNAWWNKDEWDTSIFHFLSVLWVQNVKNKVVCFFGLLITNRLNNFGVDAFLTLPFYVLHLPFSVWENASLQIIGFSGPSSFLKH